MSAHTPSRQANLQVPTREVLAWLKDQYAFVILVALVVASSIASSAFLTTQNISDVLAQLSVIGIVALGELLVIISGGIDISVGSVVGLGAVLSAGIFNGDDVLVGVGVAIGVGVLVGLINGVLVAYRGLNSFIVTLGMMSLAGGLVLAYTKGAPLSPRSTGFLWPGETLVGGYSVLGFFWLGAAIVVAFVLYRTVLGRRIYAIGSNSAASFSSGLPVQRTLVIVYVLAGALAGFGGFLETARVGAGTPTAGNGYELDAIAAVVIGGARLNGGYGRVFGAVVGTLIFGVITNELQLLNVSTYYQDAATGALVLLAVLLATVGRRKQPGTV